MVVPTHQIRSFDLTIIVISLVIGMGIFRTPSEVASNAGTAQIFFLAWAAGAIVSYLGAMTFAEIGSRYPTTGGFYKIFSFCYSPVFAFMVNWITVISNAASTAAVAIMGAEYVAPLIFPQAPETGTQIIAITSVLLLMGVNLMGIRVSKNVLNSLMVLKIMLILVLISCAFIVVQQFIGPEAIVDHGIQNRGWLESFLLCFVPVFFTYGGYQQTMNFGGDVQQASRTIPKAISRGMIIVMVLYMGVNFSYYSVLGIEGMASSKTLAADMIGITFGKAASDVLSVFMFFAVMTYLNVSILSNPRVYYAMAEDKVMPSAFLSTNQRTGVLTTGVLVFCAMIVATLFFIGSFQKILEYVMFFDSISLITAAGAIFLLRKRRVGSSDSEVFNMQGYPLVPIAYIVVYAGVNISVFIASPSAFGWGALLFLLGFPLFYLLRKVLR